MVARAVLGPEAAWGDSEELLAAIVDRLGQIAYMLRRIHFKGNADPPKPVPRPGDNGAKDADEDDPPWTPEELAEELAQFRKT